MKPVLFVTGHAPAYRVGAFARLHSRENIEVALFGGRSKHGGGAAEGELPFPHRHLRQGQLAELAANGRYRAVVCPTGGRLAPLACWAGARRGGVPLILWASLWAHPRSAAHALSYLPLRILYRSADAVVTYGPHVSDYVRARGAGNVHVAPQSVDNDFWGAPEVGAWSRAAWPSEDGTRFLFVGRPAREKGLDVLVRAWRASNLRPPAAVLVLAGVGERLPSWAASDGDGGPEEHGILCTGVLGPVELRSLYGACHALVLPSVATPTFREPWGLVANEAMNRGLPVIASDAVGAAAGGLVRSERNGLVVPAGDVDALARAIGDLAADGSLRASMGRAAAQDVLAFSHDAWAGGFSGALASVGASQAP
jgi:glycosyltransferase involved in cell wall biosynthesis